MTRGARLRAELVDAARSAGLLAAALVTAAVLVTLPLVWFVEGLRED